MLETHSQCGGSNAVEESLSNMKGLALSSCIGLLMAGALSAQEVQRFSFDLGAGFTQPVGGTNNNLDIGWNIQGGAGYNFSSYLGAKIQLDYNHMGVNSATLANLGVPGGSVGIFSASVDPIVHLNPHGHFNPYLIGGGGMYHWDQQFTAPTVSTVAGFNPFFGFFPVAVPTTAILSSYTVNKPGLNAGAGVELGTGHGKFFAEARYNHIFLGNGQHADYVPVTFGFRW